MHQKIYTILYKLFSFKKQSLKKKDVAQGLMPLAPAPPERLIHLVQISLRVVSTYSNQKQPLFKYLIWPFLRGKTAVDFDSGQMLDVHQKKRGQLSATSPSQNSELSCKPFLVFTWEGEQGEDDQTENYSAWRVKTSGLIYRQKESHATSLWPVIAHAFLNGGRCLLVHSYKTQVNARFRTPVSCGPVCNLSPELFCFKGFTTANCLSVCLEC